MPEVSDQKTEREEPATAESAARRKSLIQGAYIAALKSSFAASGSELTGLLQEKKTLVQKALRLRGIKALSLWEKDTAEEIAGITPQNLSARAQFDFACEQYLLTGKFPEGLSEKVGEVLARIPQRNGQNVLDAIAQERRSLNSASI